MCVSGIIHRSSSIASMNGAAGQKGQPYDDESLLVVITPAALEEYNEGWGNGGVLLTADKSAQRTHSHYQWRLVFFCLGGQQTTEPKPPPPHPGIGRQLFSSSLPRCISSPSPRRPIGSPVLSDNRVMGIRPAFRLARRRICVATVNILSLLQHNWVGSRGSALRPEHTLFLKPIRASGCNQVLKKTLAAVIHAPGALKGAERMN